MPELSEDALKQLRNAEELLKDLIQDGTLGSQVRAKARAKFENVTFPEDRVDAALEPFKAENSELRERLEKLQEEREAEKKAAEEAAFNKSFAEKVDSAVAAYRLNADGREKMLERMKATGNVQDPEAAAAWVVGQEPPPKPAGPSWAPSDLNMFGVSEKSQDEKIQLLHKNPERFFDNEVAEILQEFAAS